MPSPKVLPPRLPSPAGDSPHANQVWHLGSNQSTPLVNVSYQADYFNMTQPNSTLVYGNLGELMTFDYRDGSQSQFSFNIGYNFYPGGIDVQNRTVLNWSKMYFMTAGMSTLCFRNGLWVQSYYNLLGFSIVNGTASNVTFSLGHMGDGSPDWSPSNVLAALSYATSDAVVGNVTLRTVPYTQNGVGLNESVATFNVTLDSSLSADGVPGDPPSGANVSIPTVLTFNVTHNLTQTAYKYGAHIDWGAMKNFPLRTPMPTGEDFSLVAEDRVGVTYENDSNTSQWTSLSDFSTDPGNDTAFFDLNGTSLCKEFFTKQYTLAGSTSVLNTTRVYMENATVSKGKNDSAVFIIFDGFRYNESTGFSFDPKVLLPSSPPILNSVAINPPSASVNAAGEANFTASPSCTPGPCPSGIAYAWSTNNSLGHLSPTNASSTTFQAGASGGAVSLTVNASLDGGAGRSSSATVQITAQALTGVAVNPPSGEISVGQTLNLWARVQCTEGPCPSAVSFAWTLNNTGLGNLNNNHNNNTTFGASSPGDELATVSASFNGVTKNASVSIVIASNSGPGLSSVSVSVTSPLIAIGTSTNVSASATCGNGGSCPSGLTYTWTLSNTLGKLSSIVGPTVIFTAGPTPGVVTINVTVAEGGNSREGSANVTIALSVPTLSSVTLAPQTAAVYTEEAQVFNVSFSCTGPCLPGATFSWTVNTTLGLLNSTFEPSVTFTAGSSPGRGTLTVSVTVNGVTRTAHAALTITPAPPPPPPKSSSGFLGLPGMDGYALLGIVLLIVGVLAALGWWRRTPPPKARAPPKVKKAEDHGKAVATEDPAPPEPPPSERSP